MKTIAIFGAILGLTSVMMGAASDHLFSGLITAENAERLDVALRYHQLYAILILGLGLYGLHTQHHRALKCAGYIFCTGTILFCGSLYISLFPEFDMATYLTPLGGIMLMIGWCLIIFNLRRFK